MFVCCFSFVCVEYHENRANDITLHHERQSVTLSKKYMPDK